MSREEHTAAREAQLDVITRYDPEIVFVLRRVAFDTLW